MSKDLQAGDRVGQYILDVHVGGGSFGSVWRAHDDASGTPVAIKLLSGALAAADSASTRADVEVLAAAAAHRSPHVVKVLDGGSEPVPYIVMEFIEGKDLQGLLQEQRQLSVDQTIDIGLAISDALHALYEAGIVHRDIKPANVMIDGDGVIKLADFGIAKIVGYETITTAGQAPMTMAYAAPEIWNEEGAFGKPSHKSDLYAMGVLLFQCLAGFTPFRGNYGALYRAHTEQPPDISLLPADTPASLRMLIRRCLEKRQEERPHDALECQGILKRAQAEEAMARGDATLNEPRKLGPWIKDTPHDSQAWAWRCHHETSGQAATVEVHFADRLDYGANLRKALAVNPKLTPHGAERLIETNRLLLRPNESWWAPPLGEFQFWVAREDEAVAHAVSINEPQLRVAVPALRDLIHAASAEGIELDLRSENLEIRPDGRIYVRRPGLITASESPALVALAFLRSLPLTPDAQTLLTEAPDLEALAGRLASFDPSATVIMNTAQLVQNDAPAMQTQVARAAEPAAPPPPTPMAPTRRPPPAQPARPQSKGPPIPIVVGGGLAALTAIIVVVVLLSGGSDKKAEGHGEAGVAQLEKNDYAGTPAAAHTPAPNAAANVTARPEGREVVERTVLTMNPADWQCSDGSTGCRGIYSVGPFRHRGNTLRIEFEVRIVAPPGKGVEWIDDIQADEIRTKNGEEGVQIEGETGKVWHIKAAGGVANENHKSLPQGTYQGYWEFVHEEPPGTNVTFYYPDFDEVITIPLPKR